MAERLQFDILANADNAVSGFVKAGRSAAAASDDVLGLAKRLDEISKKSATARVELAGNKEAMAQLDKLDLKLLATGRSVTDAKVSVDGVLKAATEIQGLDLELDKLGAKSETASASVGSGGLSGASGLGALIGAGVVLSPIIATLATGLAGFGVAAYGAAAPIMKAAQATGGLAANMHTLNPEQQQLAKGILGLGKQYDAFSKSLQPEVLNVFGKGIKLAGDLMHQMEPVAQATGKALGGLVGSIDAEFKSGTWQKFFSFMAATAAPDMQLLGGAFTTLLDALPGLLEALQPVATGFLNIAIDGLKVVDMVSKIPGGLDKASHSGNGFEQALAGIGKVLLVPGFGLSRLLPFFEGPNGLKNAMDRSAMSAGKFGDASAATATQAQQLAEQTQAAAKQTTALMTAQQKALNVQTTYAGDLVNTANDAFNLKIALQASNDQIGLHTVKQRASFGVANTYITDLGNTATAAYASGHGVDASIKAISQGLPILDQAKTKNRQYWQEVATLVGWLNKLRNERMITESIHVSGTGQWSISPNKEVPGGTAGGPSGRAAGWRVPGFGGGDRWPVLVEGGESIVPKHLTPAVAPLLKAHGVPGFASGGVVGSYQGSVAGLPPWLGKENSATVSALAAAVASAVKTGITSARSPNFGHAGPGGGAPGANAALAHRMFPGEDFAAWNYVAMRESGWNQFALNPSSGAYGIAQALPPTKYPFAGQAAGGSNPAAQISWMEGYMQSRYGGARGAAAHEMAFNWYDSGHAYLPKGLSLAMNGTGRPERVGGEDIAPLLRQILAVLRQSPGATGHAMARGLQGTARTAGARGMYSARGPWA